MPAIRTAGKRKPPPDGYNDIEDTLLEFKNQLKDAENASGEGKKKHETLWPIFQITHQRTSVMPPRREGADLSPPRRRDESRSAGAGLMGRARLTLHLRALLRARGHQPAAVRLAAAERVRGRRPDCQVEEAGLRKGTLSPPTTRAVCLLTQVVRQLCCLRCIQTKETNFNSTCVCRVPRQELKEDQEIRCVNCGCRGCASGD